MQVQVSQKCTLSRFRRFVIEMTCADRLRDTFKSDRHVFVERGSGKLRTQGRGNIYAEAVDKQTLGTFDGVDLVKAHGMVSYTYNSMSGSTNLRWKEGSDAGSKVTGRASEKSLACMIQCGIISVDDAARFIQRARSKRTRV